MSTHIGCLTTSLDGRLRTCTYFPIVIEDGNKVEIAIQAAYPNEGAMPLTVVVVE